MPTSRAACVSENGEGAAAPGKRLADESRNEALLPAGGYNGCDGCCSCCCCCGDGDAFQALLCVAATAAIPAPTPAPAIAGAMVDPPYGLAVPYKSSSFSRNCCCCPMAWSLLLLFTPPVSWCLR